MRVYLADEAPAVVTRFLGIEKLPHRVRVLLTAVGKLPTRIRSLAKACEALHSDSLLVDSGAFRLRSRWLKHGRFPGEQEAYQMLLDHLGACVWLHRNGLPIEGVAEMDLPDLFGVDTMLRWRERLFEFQEQTGVPAIFSWHGNTPFADLIRDSRVTYIGIPGQPARARVKWITRDYSMVLSEAAQVCYEGRIKMHGYGVFDDYVFKRVPFYSVDSSSWQEGIQYGNVLSFDERTGELKRARLSKSLLKSKGAVRLALNSLKARGLGCQLQPLDVIGREVGKHGRPRPDARAILRDQARVAARVETYYRAWWRLRGIDWEAQTHGEAQEGAGA